MIEDTKRGRNLVPSVADQRAYLKSLRGAADNGDHVAMGMLVMIARLDRHTQSQPKRHRCPSGWAGDDPSRKQAFLAAIREHDPQSGQLPENR